MITKTIQVYLRDSRVFEYEITAETEEAASAKVREHAGAIMETGYRHNDGKVFEWIIPEDIKKIKSFNIQTNYPDRVSGT